MFSLAHVCNSLLATQLTPNANTCHTGDWALGGAMGRDPELQAIPFSETLIDMTNCSGVAKVQVPAALPAWGGEEVLTQRQPRPPPLKSPTLVHQGAGT